MLAKNTQKAWEIASEIVALNTKEIVIAVLANYIERELERQAADEN